MSNTTIPPFIMQQKQHVTCLKRGQTALISEGKEFFDFPITVKTRLCSESGKYGYPVTILLEIGPSKLEMAFTSRQIDEIEVTLRKYRIERMKPNNCCDDN